jgi:hypothetical protein
MAAAGAGNDLGLAARESKSGGEIRRFSHFL